MQVNEKTFSITLTDEEVGIIADGLDFGKLTLSEKLDGYLASCTESKKEPNYSHIDDLKRRMDMSKKLRNDFGHLINRMYMGRDA